MTPAEDMRLYITDHAAWCRLKAPWWRDKLRESDIDERARIWSIASPTMRSELKRLAAEESVE